MRLVYLASTLRDLVWLRHYYGRVFPEGEAKAIRRIRAAERLILDNPYVGRPTHRHGVRRLAIGRTPFFLFYRVTRDRIEVLRAIDGRSFDSMLED